MNHNKHSIWDSDTAYEAQFILLLVGFCIVVLTIVTPIADFVSITISRYAALVNMAPYIH